MQVQALKSAMGDISESFQGSSMQDAHDFAAQFIDNLKEEVTKKMELVQDKKGRVNPVVDNLDMEWEETLLCSRCGAQTVRRQKEVGLFCSLNEDPSPIGLQELIESAVESETVERRCEVNKNKYFGNFFVHSIQVASCGHKQAQQSRRLTTMPRVLLVYLKRMAWDASKSDGEQKGTNIKVLTFLKLPP